MSNSDRVSGSEDHWQEQLEEIESLASEAEEAWEEGDKQKCRRALREMDGRVTTVLEDANFL